MIRRLLKIIAGLREHVVDHAEWEMFLMRLFMLYPLYKFTPLVLPPAQPHPNGLTRWLDLTFLAHPPVLQGVTILCWVAAAFYVAGRFMVPALGILSVSLVLLGTLMNSQGFISHALQLLVMVVVAQWLAYVYAAVKRWPRHQSNIHSVHWAKVVIAASYVTAAFSKLFASSEFWIARVPYLALQIVKSNLQTYYNKLEPGASVVAERFPYWVLEHPHLARLLFGAGLALEFFSFLALVGRGWALFIGISMLLLHYSIQLIMSLEFKHHVYLLLIFYVNIPWLLAAGFGWVRRRMGQPLATS